MYVCRLEVVLGTDMRNENDEIVLLFVAMWLRSLLLFLLLMFSCRCDPCVADLTNHKNRVKVRGVSIIVFLFVFYQDS